MTTKEHSTPWEIYSFTEDNFREILTNDFTSIKQVEDKQIFDYLKTYLGKDGLNAQTIVVEKDYLSQSFIRDYKSYYLHTHKSYDKYCRRVHFYDKSYQKEEYKDLLVRNEGQGIEALKQSYLGYIVVRPLPETIIGPTVLKANTTDELSIYTTTKDIHVRFFGVDYTINTLPFQEQEKIVGACATVSLWMAFNKMASLFDKPYYSPGEITLLAGESYETSNRTFPNEGLNPIQIGRAIHAIGLDWEVRNKEGLLNNSSFMKAFIYAYLKIGLPVMIGLKSTQETDEYAEHLVTAVGYQSVREEDSIASENLNSLLDIDLSVSKLDAFYVHDDQIGPYHPIIFKQDGKIDMGGKNEYFGFESVTVTNIIVPVHPEIRIDFEKIMVIIRGFDIYFKNRIKDSKLKNLEWDTYLAFSSEYKRQAAKDPEILESLKERIIFSHYPRFVWVSTLRSQGQKIFELVFDATELRTNFVCHDIFIFVKEIENLLRSDIRQKKLKSEFFEKQGLHENYFNEIVQAVAVDTKETDIDTEEIIKGFINYSKFVFNMQSEATSENLRTVQPSVFKKDDFIEKRKDYLDNALIENLPNLVLTAVFYYNDNELLELVFDEKKTDDYFEVLILEEDAKNAIKSKSHKDNAIFFEKSNLEEKHDQAIKRAIERGDALNP